jgi:hypothetical protein
MVTCPRCRTKFSDAQTITPGICPECNVDIASFCKAWGLADPVKRPAYDKSIGMEAEISKESPPPTDGTAGRKRSPELQGKSKLRQMKEKLRQWINDIGRLKVRKLEEEAKAAQKEREKNQEAPLS